MAKAEMARSSQRSRSSLPGAQPQHATAGITMIARCASTATLTCQDQLGSRCDPYLYTPLDDRDYNVTCHNNLSRAVAPYHLTEFDVHDVLNVFQVTGLDPVHEIYFMEPSPAKKGDFFEFFAEIDLLCAISTCPSGDLSKWGWGPEGADPVANCHPLGVEVYEPASDLLEGWKPPEPVHVKSVYLP